MITREIQDSPALTGLPDKYAKPFDHPSGRNYTTWWDGRYKEHQVDIGCHSPSINKDVPIFEIAPRNQVTDLGSFKRLP